MKICIWETTVSKNIHDIRETVLGF